MSGIDIEGVLSAHGGWMCERVGDGWRCWCGVSLLDYWPAGGVTPRDTALGVAHRAHVAAVLREQIVTWLTSEALRTDLLAQVNAEDDAQFAGGASHGLGAHDATDFVLAALAAHLSDTERAGGAG